MTEGTPPVGSPISQLRNGLLPLEALLEATRIGLGVPEVHIALRPDVLQHLLGEAEGALSGPPETAERTLQLFGLHLSISPLVLAAVVESGSPLAVEDTRTHALLRTSPVVDSRRLLAVVAAPLRDADGQVAGALYAGEGRPRWWNERDTALLGHMARVAEPLLAHVRSVVAGSQARRSETIRSTPVATTPVNDAPVATTPVSDVPVSDVPVNDIPVSEAPTTGDENGATAGVLNALAEGILLLGEDWQVRWHNTRAGDHFAIPLNALQERDIREAMRAVVDPTVLSAWERAMTSDRLVPCSWHQPRADRWFAGYAVRMATGLLIVVRDVTLQRRAETASEARAAQVREGETLDAIALLAGGVAHDFNNLLTVISANAELLQLLLSDADGQTELRAIRQAAVRATQFTEQLLASGQQLALQPDVVLLNDLLGALEPELASLLPDGVRVDSSLTSLDTRVQVDPARVAQVVRQLVRNAGDAMAAGGVLRVSTEVRVLDSPLRARPKTVPAGAWVVLELIDNGHGVAPAQLDRIFEPFFTTRAVGAGLGLGLATAYGIVAQSGGACTVESQLGMGTIVRVWLPALTPVRRGTTARS